MNTLTEIFAAIPDAEKTDKGTSHSYIEFYEQQLFRFRDMPIKLLEIGVNRGKSLRLWSQYFTHPDAKIIGLDIKPVSLPIPRVTVLMGDAKKYDPGDQTFDVIIDDGSHNVLDQFTAFDNLWPKLSLGGLYVIEDVPGETAIRLLAPACPELQVEDRRHLKKRWDDILLWGIKT